MAAPAGGKLEHAYLKKLEPTSKGRKGGDLGTIRFSFNPKEFTLQRQAEWKSKPSKKPQPPEFNGTKGGAISLEMFLDASEHGDVVESAEALFDLVRPVVKTKGTKPSPPFVLFGWGSHTYVTAVVKSVSVRYTRFKSDGTPIRAVATITLEEIIEAEGKQNPTSGGRAVRRSRTVGAGDSLASIAFEELGSPERWRELADANGIDDPFRLRSGTELLVPILTEA